MNISKTLLATAAIGALVGAALPAEANAKAKGASSQSSSEIEALKAQIEALKARLDAQDAANAQAQAAAQATAEQAAAAQAAATAAQASADDVKKTADKAAKDTGALAKLVDGVKDTKISGRMYFNISNISADNLAGANVEKRSGFQIKRFYVGIDHRFSPIFSGNITVDVDNVLKSATLSGSQPTGYTLSTSNTGQGLYIKKAYLQAKFRPELMVRLGAADLPWVPYAEGLYGYRHIEKVVADLNGYGTSADWGVHVLGDIGGGLISYQLSALDGGGYRNPTLTKTVDFEGRVSLNYKGFNAAVGGYTGKLGRETTNALGGTTRTSQRFNALLAYKGKLSDMDVTIGGEYFYTKNWKKVSVGKPDDKAMGWSGFASVSPIKQWSVFGRYDWVKETPLQKERYWNLGVQYSPAKIVDLALVYKHDNADGLITGNLGSNQNIRNEIGLYGQFRW